MNGDGVRTSERSGGLDDFYSSIFEYKVLVDIV